MKRYKRIVPSVLALSLTLSSVSTSDVFATTNTDITDNSKDVVFEELTTGSAIEIAPLPAKTTETTGVLTNANINPRGSNTITVDGWTFKYDDTLGIPTAEIIETTHYGGDVVIPATVTVDDVTYTVTKLGDQLFYNARGLSSVSIPDGVTYIGKYSFSFCWGLTEITLPDTLTYIDDYAFHACESLTKIEIPNGVTYIGKDAFSFCWPLAEITLPDSLTYIGDGAFLNCVSLSKIVIPDGVTHINDQVFSSCVSLTEVVLPDTLTSIGNGAFQSCISLSEVVLPAGLTSIGNNAFYYCTSLSEVVLPAGLTSIGNNAFMFCESLTEINFPSELTTIGSAAFSNTGIIYFNIPKSVTDINHLFLYPGSYSTLGILTPEANNPNRQEGADKAVAVYVVNSEGTSPLDGEVFSTENVPLEAGINNFVYAKYEITPELDLDGGEMHGNVTFPAWATAETLTDYLGTPTKANYVFGGWEVVEAKTINSNGVDYLVGPADNTPQLKLKAIWRNAVVTKDVTFDSNGGSPTKTVIKQTEGSKYVLPTQPTKDGFNFLGWFDSSNNQITTSTVVTNLVDNKVITAKWAKIDVEEPVVKPVIKDVTFDANGGSPAKTVIKQTTGEKYVLPTQPTRDGFTFLGWFDSSNKQITSSTVVTDLVDNKVITAKWLKLDIEEPAKPEESEEPRDLDNAADSDVDYDTPTVTDEIVTPTPVDDINIDPSEATVA